MTPAVTAAKRAGIVFDVVEYDTGDAAEHTASPGASAPPARSGLAAEADSPPSSPIGATRALGIAPKQVFETLVVDLPGTSLAIAIIPVAARLDLEAGAGVAAPQARRSSTTLRCVPVGRWLTRPSSPASNRSGSAR